MSLVKSLDVDIKVELGSTLMPIHHVLRLGRGAVIELDATEDDPMVVFGNNRQIALGEILIDDERLSIKIIKKVATSAP